MGKHIGATKSPVLKKNNHYMTSDYGMRTLKGVTKMHNGIDLKNGDKPGQLTGDTIIAIADGVVSYVGSSKSRGNYVELKHKNGYKTRYLHMKDNSIVVKTKQKVLKGQALGYTGATGEGVTGVHVHLAVILPNGSYTDPKPYLYGDKTFDDSEWVEGKEYRVLYHKYLRSTPEVKSNNKAKYKNLNASCQKKCIKDALGYAKYKIGAKITIKEFKNDKKGNKWGRTNELWLCVKDSTGNQVEKV